MKASKTKAAVRAMPSPDARTIARAAVGRMLAEDDAETVRANKRDLCEVRRMASETMLTACGTLQAVETILANAGTADATGNEKAKRLIREHEVLITGAAQVLVEIARCEIEHAVGYQREVLDALLRR